MSNLKDLFNPRGIAVIGASRDPTKIGHIILKNIVEYGYRRGIYPVNPSVSDVMGLKTYPAVSTISDKVDVVIVSIPNTKVPEAIDDAGKAGVKHAVVIASGFKEIGNVDLENEVVRRARRHGMRVLGPNIFGYVYTPVRLNATFGPRDVIPGNVAFITQSGALGIALMGSTILEGIGISAIVSVGNKSDIDDADLLEFFDEDPNTSVVLIYMEGVSDGRRFVNVASKISMKKPVIVIKSGRTEAGARAAASHTGSLAGNVALYESAFKQSGVISTKSVEEAFDFVKTLSWNPLPPGDRVVVITNGGGAGVQASDTLADDGIYLEKPPQDFVEEVRKILPPFASLANPVDLTGMAPEDWYYRSVKSALQNSGIDAVLVLYCHTALTSPVGVARAVAGAVDEVGVRKPISVAIIGGLEAYEAIKHLTNLKIPAYPTPERAAHALAAQLKYRKYREYLIKKEQIAS
ncbi:MAG: CoA-binding protein [Sulfolobales archaeon]|nr:CoA-binding protein [Sulfolobales archaeon]MDW8082425.1 CoA-binding protein [Sulfolobales archaeon]